MRLDLDLGLDVLPFTAPVGVDVDETDGTLLVTDSGGYPEGPEGFDFGPSCSGNGCGALLRIDPDALPGPTATIASGPNSPGQHLMENPYGLVARPDLDDALVADPGTARIIHVDLDTGVQSPFNVVPPSSSNYAGGLRSPWGLARAPGGDILVVNGGNSVVPASCVLLANGFCSGEFEIPVPADCEASRGYVLRLSEAGNQDALYCSPRFERPRNVTVDADGRIFVVDPFAAEGVADSGGFGTVLVIDPADGSVEPVTAGTSMAAPSGIDFNEARNRLVVADETLFPYAGPCVTGCGGLVQVNPDGGAQSVLAEREAGGAWVDPIDVAVDHTDPTPPSLPVNTVPRFLDNLGRPSGAPPDSSLKLFPVRGDSAVSLVCLDAGCVDAGGAQQRRPVGTVPAGSSSFGLPLTALPADFTYYTCPYRKYPRLKGSWCYAKKKKKKKKRSKKQAARLSSADALGSAKGKGGKRKSAHPAKGKSLRLLVNDSPLPTGRFVDFTLAGTTITFGAQGCANGSTPVGCPPDQ